MDSVCVRANPPYPPSVPTGTSGPGGASSHARPPAPGSVTVLRYARCCDCGRFSTDALGSHHCEAGIGGTVVHWPSGQPICRPAPGEWHYCAAYDGPRVSQAVWVWRKRT